MSGEQFSMCAAVRLMRDKAGVLHACLGVDVQAARPAPIGKRFGIDINAHDGMAFASELLLTRLGFHQPFVIGSGELVAIGHDPADGAVIFEVIPDHASDADGVIHNGDLS